ncbi:MAG TPA: RNA polymerase sigma-70 factor [Thermomicrobiales bacterium]|nr:RNA polymerase sigma-70 factor [Thermomicrobiales bacterium]
MQATPVDTFQEYRPLLFSIAYRMLGSVMDAEDAVQETYLRWQRAAGDATAVASPKSYLTTVVTRLCIDQARSAEARHTAYVGPDLPEPLSTEPAPDAAGEAELADTLSTAFLIVLETLSPVERAAFLLRDVFAYDYPEIARVTGKGEANCRQLVRRARQRVAERRPRFPAAPEQRRRLTDQFMQTCQDGDLDGLVALLADDITLWSDGGGKVAAARFPIHGAPRVARALLGIFRKAPAGAFARPADLNGTPGLVAYQDDGTPLGTLTLDIADGRISGVYLVVNPDKLRALPPAAS